MKMDKILNNMLGDSEKKVFEEKIKPIILKISMVGNELKVETQKSEEKEYKPRDKNPVEKGQKPSEELNHQLR